jgi:hypothetical protein
VLHLYQNMCLNTAIEAEKDFVKWQLDVDKGMHTDNNSNILLPNLYHCRENTAASLIETIYSGITRPNLSVEYFAKRTILYYPNKDVDTMNHKVLQEFSGRSWVFYSADSISTSELSGEDDPLLNYPVEYLNEINCTGMPLANLEVKIGCSIMVLKNLDTEQVTRAISEACWAKLNSTCIYIWAVLCCYFTSLLFLLPPPSP